ncbi:acyltransferase family protein [Aureimonas pseudogalii]|uniref:Exopolysaccharide production protein ExoZ n=1 Tax=Aureimonas pseudogalii TaxID=1744844 RepID=A0A7W6H872_9HYPH|nr:acyltransferase [Aureimonas pseudogalii]MBB4000211.1 exopolysaccharide production protein ExoZ [Aureimonas pseudogalii]
MIFNLQILRAVAALMVVVFHATDGAGRLGESAALPRFDAGQMGVDLFFVISGFIIWTTTRGASGASPRRFAMKRLVRVVPLYWLLTLVLANVAALRPDLLGTTVLSIDHLVASLAFVPWPHPTIGLYNPLLVIGWTLNYEMAFYALFGLALLLPARHQFVAVTAVLVSLATLGLAADPGGIAGFYCDPIILEFAMGLAIGRLYTKGRVIGARVSTLVALLGAALLLWLPLVLPAEWRVASGGMPSALLVAGLVFRERARGPLHLPRLQALGDASYALYLTHVLTLPVAQIVWRKLMPTATGPFALLFVAAATLACCIGGLFAHRIVERPLTWLLRPNAKSASPQVRQARVS